MATFEQGQTLAGKYEVEDILGRGGMGVVVRATHIDLDAKVAIKVLHGPNSNQPEIAQRFLREAQAASKLKSEFVARVTDFGRLPDGDPFMVMELLVGEDFGVILDRGPIDPTFAVDSILQAVSALSEAHAAGIIHRDIKPSNLFRTTRPDGSLCVKVLDFGISKIDDGQVAQSLTQTGSALGTPFYMSPEQIRKPKDVDERTDVWSLGVVLYEMLTGQPPFQGDQLGELFAQILETTPEPIESLKQGLPEGLADVVRRCLEKDRAKRVSGMRALADLLLPFASAEGGLAARRATIVASSSDRVSLSSKGAKAQSNESEARSNPSIELAETLAARSDNFANENESQSDNPRNVAPSNPPSNARKKGSTASRDERTRRALLAIVVCVAAVATVAFLATRKSENPSAIANPVAEPVQRATAQSRVSPSTAAPPSNASAPSVTPAVAMARTADAIPTPPQKGSAAPSTNAPLSNINVRPGPTLIPGASTAPKPVATTLW